MIREDFEKVYSEAQKILEEQGINISNYPEINKKFQDPIQYLKDQRKDPNMRSQMGMFDRVLLQGLKSK